MKRRLKYFLIVCLGVLALAFVGGSADSSILADDTTHEVTFSYNVSRIKDYMDGDVLNSLQTVTQRVEHGETTSSPELSSSDVLRYYTYEWTLNGVVVNVEDCVINKATNFVAKWTPREYKVYFKYGDYADEITNRVSGDYITFTVESPRINLYRPNRPNYVFKGWYEQPNDEGSIECLYISPRSVGDKTLYAKFRPVEYYIDYHTSATHNNPQGYNVEDGDITLEAPTLYGHIFKGWYLDEKFKTPATTIDCRRGGNIDLYAMWELETYDVTYILPSGLTKTVKVEYGATAELPKLDKSIFEIVKTSTSRKNITEDTTITVEYVNIWYVYLIALVVVGGTIALVIVLKKRRENTHNNLRAMYYSNINGKRK